MLIQILDSCSTTLGTCCNDYALAGLLSIIRSGMDIVQIIVPIILIISGTVSFIQLMIKPDDEKGALKKALGNKFTAAIIVFLLPFIVNLVLDWTANSYTTFNVVSCWQAAQTVAIKTAASESDTKISTTAKDKTSLNEDLSALNVNVIDNSPKSSSTNGSATGNAIVAYAKQFLGKEYVYGGEWNGELPYTPTDCSGFVQGLFHHFGISIPRDTVSQWAATDTYTLVPDGQQKAGDLVMYYGHVAMITGNGNEIIHDSNHKDGVKISSDFHYRSIQGIMRINGVN
jgi:cell wall-associated NlpC family hydrolase